MSLKPIKEIRILTVDDYIELFGKPREDFNENDQLILDRWIRQAEQQFDSLVSTNRNVGSIFRWWTNLKDNDEDNEKGYRLQYAIGSWVETYVMNGKYWVDNVPTLQSNISYEIKSQANDSNVELKRKDIIQSLSSIGLTMTTNFGNTNKNNEQDIKEVEEYAIVTKDFLVNNYLALDSFGNNQTLKSGVNFSECPIINGGDISTTNPNKKKIINYRLQGCDILPEDGNNIKVEQANKVLDPNDGLYKFINQFPISTWNGLTEEQINYRIKVAGCLYSLTIPYSKGFIVMFLIKNVNKKAKTLDANNLYGFAMSKIDNNIGNDPNNSPDAWEILPANPANLNAIIEWCKEYINNKLTPIDYVSDYGSEIFTFASEQDYNNFLTNANIDNSYFENVEKPQRIIFYAGEVKLFATMRQAMETMARFDNLVQGEDFQIIEAGYYLRTHIEAGTGGSNLIKQSDLPNINLSHNHTYSFGGGPGSEPGLREGYNGHGYGFTVGTSTTNLYLNGNVEQTEFQPKYINVAMVQILKDIRG